VGPGNNGGDGLVAARHLLHFGYLPSILYPKPPKEDLYKRLLTQCKQLDIPILSTSPTATEIKSEYSLLLDSIFGFSFDAQGGVREPYGSIIQTMIQSSVPIASVDIPSGWHVEKGDIHEIGIKPEMLISLTAPKLCARFFNGPYHFLGGRFVPHWVRQKYALQLPPYPGTEQCIQLLSSDKGKL